LVFQPTDMAAADLLRTLDFLKFKKVPILGLISNMSYCLSPSGERFWPFLSPEVDLAQICKEFGIPLLGEMLDKLNQLGLLKKSGEEGSATQIEMLDKLNQLGLLKKPGEGAEGSQTIMALQTEVKELRESMQKQEMDAMKNAVVSISNQLGEMRKDMANQGKLEGRYALLDKTIGAIENQLTGIRTDAKPLLSAIGAVGGKEPPTKSPE
ncbi:unnamed protein product, partial [marine sediment metagenome]